MNKVKKSRKGIHVFTVTAALVMGMVLAVSVSVWATSIGTDISVSGDTAVTGKITVSSSSATSTIATGGFTVGTTHFAVVQTNGFVGVSSSTPWGLFSVESVQGTVNARVPMFVVGDAGTSTAMLLVNEAGFVGIASNTPVQALSVNGSAYIINGLGVGVATTTAGVIDATGNVVFGNAQADLVGINAGTVGYVNVSTTTIPNNTLNAFSIATSTTARPFLTFNSSNTRVGISTTTPGSTFAVEGNVMMVGGLGVGAATTTPGVIETKGNIYVQRENATSTLRLKTKGVNAQACIEFVSEKGTFMIIATSAGVAMIVSGDCG